MRNRLIALLLFGISICLPLQAADQQTLLAEDRIRIRAYVEPEQEYYLGQQARFFIEVVTDTWFTTAPRYPEVRVAGAVVLDPERFSTNVTVRDDGRTLNGQRHGYLIYPQRAEMLTVPPQTVRFAVSVDGKPSKEISLTSQPVSLKVVIPPGVSKPANLVTATNYSLKDDFDTDFKNLKVGDSITRRVTQSADDVQALLLPTVQFVAVKGLAIYPGEPKLENSTNRGQYRGSRTDTVTYMVEKAGDYELPAIEVEWWDPEAERLRKPKLESESFTALPNPDALRGDAVADSEVDESPGFKDLLSNVFEWLTRNVQLLCLLLGGAYLLSLVYRRYSQPLLTWFKQRRPKEKIHEAENFRILQKACNSGSSADIHRAFWLWADSTDTNITKRLAGLQPDKSFQSAWLVLNRSLYSGIAGSDFDRQALLAGFKTLRYQAKRQPESLNQQWVSLNP
ncbi:MAG: hypothetical protein ACR2QG_05680 [Gammaproteobacteria bacterium]